MSEIRKDRFVFIEQTEDESEKMYKPSITYWQDAWRRLRKNKIAISGLLIIIIFTAFAVVAPMVSTYNHEDINLSNINMKPSSEHIFGTDNLGRDLWCRVWMGARISLFIALVAAVVQTTIGIVIGGISGFFGGRLDTVIMRASDIIDSIPFLIYVIIIMMILGSGIMPIIVAFAVTGWIGMARLVRGQVMQIKEQDFVMAVKGLGGSSSRILRKHLIPNILGVIIITLTMRIPSAIFTEAYLSYIGIGLQPPLTSWGQLANAGAKVMRVYPYQLLIPGFFISVTMLALQLLGDGLRDALDPKFRK